MRDANDPASWVSAESFDVGTSRHALPWRTEEDRVKPGYGKRSPTIRKFEISEVGGHRG